MLADVISSLGQSGTLQQLLDRVVSVVCTATESTGAFVHLWEAESERLVLRAATEGDQRPYLGVIQLRLGEGITGWCARSRNPIVINEKPLEDPHFKYFPELKEERFESTLVVPILTPDGKVVGTFSLWGDRPGYFSDDHLSMSMEVASLLATVIERAQLDEQARRRAQVLSFLDDLASTLSSPRPIEDILNDVAAMTVDVVESELCVIVLLDPVRGKLLLKGIAPSRADIVADFEQDIYRRALSIPRQGEAGATAPDEMFSELAKVLPERFPEAASAPLVAASDHLGFINCYRSRRYLEEDRRILTVIAAQVALALQAARGGGMVSERNPAGELFALLAQGRTSAAVASIAAALGADLSKSHVLLDARLLPKKRARRADLPQRMRSAMSTLVETIYTYNPGSVVHASAGRIVGLVRVSSPDAAVTLQRRLQELGDELSRRSAIVLSAGVSSVNEQPSSFPDGYREAAEALEIGTNVWGEGHVVRFDELGPYVYLFRIAADPRAGRDPLMDRLLPLVEYDRRKKSQLLDTLDAYLECRGNASATAERLMVHRNTLRQRLARIETVTGLKLEQMEDWLPVHLGVRLAKLRLRGHEAAR